MAYSSRIYGSEVERFWPKVDKAGPIPQHRPDLGPCWLWTAARRPDGYGVLRSATGRAIRAHVWAWEQENGPVPEGLELDHLCRVTRCVRPSHLEAVTHQENSRRAPAGGRAWRRLRTHCKNGHLFDEATTRIYRGKRICRACEREQRQARKG